MELRQIHSVTFDTEETIVCASLIGADEWVMLLSSGQVLRFTTADSSVEFLFGVNDNLGYKDGGFKVTAQSSIYSLDTIVVVVNDYGLHGYVHYPGKYAKLHLWRKEYHADVTQYPIALYKNEAGIPHLIYGADWNHLQIMNLDTRQIITSAKSLIEEDAEEKYLEFHKKYVEEEKQPWPAPYDYFYGGLLISLDKKKFLSKGWTWGSQDFYNIYDIADFISKSRITYKNVGCWEHENRAACWVDNDTIAIAYHPFLDSDDESAKDNPVELHIYSLNDIEAVVIKRIVINNEPVMPKNIFYCNSLKALIATYAEKGIIVSNSDGEILFRNVEFCPNNFYPELQLFLSFNGQMVSVHRLDEK